MMRNKAVFAGIVLAGLMLSCAVLPGSQAWAQDDAAVTLSLKNDSGSSVDVELVDQYGGNFTATVSGNTSQNQTLKAGSEIKVGGTTIHVVAASDEGTEIVIASP